MPQQQKWFKNFLKSIDIYAKPIQLTYMGRDKFTSTCGGFLSLAVVVFIISAFAYSARDLVLRNQTQIQKNTIVSLSNSYSPPEDLSEKNITFAFMLSDFYATKSYEDPYYGEIILRQKTLTIKQNETDGTMYREIEHLPIPFSKCEVGRNIFYENEKEIEKFAIGNYYCPDWQNLTLQGNFYSPVHKRVELIFKRCDKPYPECADDAEFKDWVRRITMIEIMISTQFDINDYEKPIKYFMEDQYYPLLLGQGLQSIIWFKKNTLQLNDNLLGLFNSKSDDYFYQLSGSTYLVADPDTGPGEGFYFFQMFKLDKQVDIYTRNVYTVMGVLKDVGGFYNSLFFLGLFLYSKFQGTIVFSSLISKLYQIEQMDIEENPSEDPSLSKKSSIFMNRQRTNSLKGSMSQQHKTKSNHKTMNKKVKEIKEELLANIENPSDTTIQKIKAYLGNRWRIQISLMDNFKFVYDKVIRFFCRCCLAKKDLRAMSTIQERKIALYHRGEEKVKNELDCISILTKLRYLDVLVSLFLNSHQKLLLGFQRKNVIQEDMGGYKSSEDDQGAAKDILNKLNFENPSHSNIQKEDELDYALDAMSLVAKTRLRTIDQKILLGIVSRAPNKHTEKDNILSDGSSSSAGSDPDMEKVAANQRRMKESMFDETIKSSSTRNLMKLNGLDQLHDTLNPELKTEGGASRIWYGTQSPSRTQASPSKPKYGGDLSRLSTYDKQSVFGSPKKQQSAPNQQNFASMIEMQPVPKPKSGGPKDSSPIKIKPSKKRFDDEA